jgi:3-oxoacyl-[acyl-carrier protein] reductase
LLIKGKTIVVTGGASGLGLGFAKHLSLLGAKVWALDKDIEALTSQRHDPATSNENIKFVTCDVSSLEQVEQTLNKIINISGGVDVLINNAAVLRDQTLVSKLGKKIKKHSIDDWNTSITNNLTSAFIMSREVAAIMIENKIPGLIINISSISRFGNAGQSAYAATKSAIDALTSTWAIELAPYNIRVTSIAPGFVQTAITKNIPPIFLIR